MNKQHRIKLDLIRIEGICKMLLSKIDHDELKNKIETVTKVSDIKDIKSAINRLSRQQLIKIIELSPSCIKGKDIDQAYEQYRYGLKPGFILFQVSRAAKKVSIAAIEKEVKESLDNLVDGELDNYKGLKYKNKSKIVENVYEFTFMYLSKYSYISENEEPKYIYELEECFVWISLEDNFIAIQNSPNKVINIFKKIFAKVYEASVNNVKLTKTLIKEIFDESSMKKGAFYKPTAGKDEAQRVTISDPHLAEKDVVKNSLQDYDITSSYLNEQIDENSNSTLGINCNQGKIYLTKNMTATVFRDWSVRRIRDIINYLKEPDSSIDFDIFKAKNIMEDDIWKGFNQKQKNILEEIIYRIYLHKQRKNEADVLKTDFNELYTIVGKNFISELRFNCNECDDMAIAFCKKCGSSSLTFNRSGLSLTCNECGEQQSTTFSVVCEEGHINTFYNIEELLVLYPTYELLSKCSAVLKKIFDISFNPSRESFYLQGNNIVFLELNDGKYILPDNLAELDAITTETITEDEYDKLICKFDGVKEKCKNSTNDKCNKCLLSQKDTCIMKLFSTYKGYRPSPHQAMEFGDVNFPVTYQGEEIELVGIAKSRIEGKAVLNLSETPSREMVQQYLSMTHDTRVGIIAVICPMRFHDQLKQELIYISKLTNSKLTIFDDEFMIKQLKHYNKVNNINIV
ncbi:hypothetical protein HMPREF1982_00770 [Clostridiales bacterium oral taxon 876 str. F0540]|nr:hypothetical protein HMPREF1982_00770 [Clostridiales bacterium oral taxon 876 str. F0540]